MAGKPRHNGQSEFYDDFQSFLIERYKEEVGKYDRIQDFVNACKSTRRQLVEDYINNKRSPAIWVLTRDLENAGVNIYTILHEFTEDNKKD